MTLDDVLKLSPFVADVARKQPEILEEAFWQAGFPSFFESDDFAALKKCADIAELKQKMRLFRQKQAARLVIRDYLGLDSVQGTLKQLTQLAESLLQVAVDWLYVELTAKYGSPIGADSGQLQRLVVLGMGKLGGGELNFSSDIDLIACFPESGETDGIRPLDNQQFFIKLVQQLTPLLSEQTADGFVYRVDWRLRPFGSTGPLAVSFASMVQYYEVHGRDWERYALLKARPVAGDLESGAALLAELEPFVYRRYLDFSAIDALRDLKQQIDAQVRQKGMENNIKLGPGGIREVEFWVQAFQLLYGGRYKALRTPSLYEGLAAIEALRLVDADTVAAQCTDYDALRRVENHLQMYADEQMHTLPEDTERLDVLAVSLGYDGTNAFMSWLASVRAHVQQRFDTLFRDETASVSDTWQQLWQTPLEWAAPLGGVNAEVISSVQQALEAFRTSAKVARLSAEARQRLDEVMPLLLQTLFEIECDDLAEGVRRLLQVVEAVTRRSVYLVMLKQHGQAREELVKLVCASPWLTEMLVRHPALLEWLMTPDALYETPQQADYIAGVQAVLSQWGEDEEQFMEQLRHWKQLQVFQVAAQDVMGVLPVMVVSDHLTWIAEAVLKGVHQWVMQWMIARHGALPGGELLVVGYGKLGGYELGYGSDLDVVFLYDAVEPSESSDGARPLDGQTWMIRAAQKMVFVLTTQMVSGRLYEVDARLRPNGQDGLLAVSLKSYRQYLQEKAWLWELQALVRARCVVGGKSVCAAFAQVRTAVLRQPRETETVRQAVVNMREKMRRHLDTRKDCFDLKQGRGGLVDIEFIVQYLILAHGHRHAAPVCWTDNVRQLEALAADRLLPEAHVQVLKEAYLHYRHLGHRLALQQQGRCVAPEQVAPWPERVGAVWQVHTEEVS